MNEIRESVNAVEIKPQTCERTGGVREKGSAHKTTIFVLRERLLKARNKLATLEKDLEDRQIEFDGLARANEAKTPGVANNDLAKHEKRLSMTILETEYASARMESAVATLNERLAREYAITEQFAEGPPPPPHWKNRSR